MWGIQRHLLYHQCSNSSCTARKENHPSGSLQLLVWLHNRIVLISWYFTILFLIFIHLLQKHLDDGEINVIHTRCTLFCSTLQNIIRTATRMKTERNMDYWFVDLAITRRSFESVLLGISNQYYWCHTLHETTERRINRAHRITYTWIYSDYLKYCIYCCKKKHIWCSL